MNRSTANAHEGFLQKRGPASIAAEISAEKRIANIAVIGLVAAHGRDRVVEYLSV